MTGKSPSIWDNLTHSYPYATEDLQNADVANDSYKKYKRDVEMIRELGLDVYRFSLSWTRILPTGFPNAINQAGIDYYNKLINEMLKYNIQPVVTLYHWDLPQKLQDLGGWANPYIVDWFTDYSRIAFQQFGDRVKYWITINEPREICYAGYGEYMMAPRIDIKGYAEYLCAKNVLMSHAKTYHLYDKEFRPTQGGIIGITINAAWFEAETNVDAKHVDELTQFEVIKYF